MIVPAVTARTTPTTTYAMAVAQPKMLASRINEARSTRGEEIRNRTSRSAAGLRW